jgi:hypothetical protein
LLGDTDGLALADTDGLYEALGEELILGDGIISDGELLGDADGLLDWLLLVLDDGDKEELILGE